MERSPTRELLLNVRAALVVLAAFGGAAGSPALAQQSGEVREFEITAERFQFTPNSIEVTHGDRVRLIIHSRDVTHGFSIEPLGIDVPLPHGGEPATVEFIADRPGTFQFACSVYCGRGHEGMTGLLTVSPASADPAASAVRQVPTEAYPGEFDDLSLDPAEPDFTVITLPTTRRVPRFRSAFRVTHRFTRPLGIGDFGDLASDLFGLDGGARIGLELRFGLAPGTQVGIYRTSDRTIQLFGQQTILQQQADGSPVGVGVFASVEGLDNFRDEYAPALGVLLSRTIADRAAFYVEPLVLGNADVTDRFGVSLSDGSDDDTTVLVGLAARIRFLSTAYLVAEFIPRVGGFDPGDHHVTVGIEKRVGGHLFQLNFSNSIGSTVGQLARGASTGEWFMGFNITRRFF